MRDIICAKNKIGKNKVIKNYITCILIERKHGKQTNFYEVYWNVIPLAILIM